MGTDKHETATLDASDTESEAESPTAHPALEPSRSQREAVSSSRMAVFAESFWAEGHRRVSRLYLFAKRTFDIVVSLVALILTIPIWIVVAIAIRLESRGPIIYRQLRSGRNNVPFTMYKFRSMHSGADQYKDELTALNEMDGPVFKIREDPRVTRVGRFIRRWSLDELPQLLNIIKGEMTIVGPRPLPVREVAQLSDHQMRRQSVRPGLTCIWQISGRNEIPFDEWIQLDLIYIASRSFWLDIEIFFRTFAAVLKRKGST